MRYPFGKDISHFFQAVDSDGNPLAVAATAPTIYVYKDRPTLDQARNGTGSNQQGSTITSWTTLGKGKAIAIPAIDDANPTNTETDVAYYVCVNYYLTALEQIQTRIDEIILYKATSQNSEHGVTLTFIKQVYPSIPSYLSDDNIKGQIDVAVEMLKLDLDASGYKWAQVQDVYRYKLAIAFKALELAARGQRKEERDRFDLYAADMKELYEKAVTVKVDYDSDSDGTPDTITQKSSYTIAIT